MGPPRGGPRDHRGRVCRRARGAFVYDDRTEILRNPNLSSLGSFLRSLGQPFWQFAASDPSQHAGPYYRPLCNAALLVVHSLCGGSALGWHLFPIALHLAATALVYALARSWELDEAVSIAAALLFGLHPVHSETTAWISAFPDPLASLFILSALVLLERGRRFSAAGLGFLAMLTKEVAVVFPAVVFARELLRGTGPSHGRLKRAIVVTLPSAALAVVALVIRWRVLGFIGSIDASSAGVPNAQVLLTIPYVLVFYLRMLVWPFGLAVAYPLGYVTSAADPRFWGSLLLLAVLAVLSLAIARRVGAAGLAAVAFSLAFLLPALNLKAFNRHESLLHDRYLYLPSIGFCLLAALGLRRLAARFGGRVAFPALVAAAAVPFFALTVRQNLFWKDDAAMARRGLDVTHGRNAVLLDILGAYQMNDLRDPAAAAQSFEEALRLEPDDLSALVDLAVLRKEAARYPEAEALYEKALRAGAPAAATCADLGTAYLLDGKIAEGVASLERALKLDPESTAARYNLAWAYQKQGRNADAEREYRETLRRRPESLEAGINLGLVLIAEGKLAEARAEFIRLRALAPGNQVVLEHLASLGGV